MEFGGKIGCEKGSFFFKPPKGRTVRELGTILNWRVWEVGTILKGLRSRNYTEGYEKGFDWRRWDVAGTLDVDKKI